MNFVACFALLGYCFALKRLSKWPIEYTPFFVISSIIVLLYGFAYFHFLEMGANLILIVGAPLFFVSPIFVCKEPGALLQKYLTPGFVISSLLLTLFLFLASHIQLSQWDEFTHWGPHSKLMWMHHSLIQNSDVVIHPSYPAGGALFQYLFLHASGFHEGTLYIAQNILILAPLSIFLSHYSWKDWKKALICYLGAIILLFIFHTKIGFAGSLYMDNIVGIYFGMSVVAYLASGKKVSNILYLIPIIAALMIFKQKLLPFVFMISLVMFIDQWMKKNIVNSLFILILPMTSLLITKSWHHYLQTIHIPIAWKLNITLETLKNHFLAPIGTIPHVIITNYFHALIPAIYVIFGIILINGLSYFFYQDKHNRTTVLWLNLLFFAGWIAYVIGLLLLYLFSFDPYEGVHHASMNRYLNIYYLAWSLVTLFFLFDATRDHKKYENSILLILCAALFFILIAQQSNREYHTILRLREPISKIASSVNHATKPDAKIFIVWQRSTGLERAILLYELTPRKPNLSCSSFGAPYFPGDVWTCSLTPKQFLKAAHSFDYLLLAHTDHNFWEHYQTVLPNRNQLKPLMTYQICLDKKCISENNPVYLLKITGNRK